MTQIGQFTRTKSGFAGRIQTLTLDRDITLVPAELSDTDNAPDYRVHCAGEDDAGPGPEIGAAWKRTGEKAGNYVSLQLDDPSFGHPIRANLFQLDRDKDDWSLHWNRPPKRNEKG